MQKILTLSQLPPGTTHVAEVGDYSVLFANVGGEVYAVENKCSHFGLPLDKGALCEHRLRCPFHHACFDVRDGAQLEAPGMDGLRTFAVRTEGQDILVAPEPTVRPTENYAPAAPPESGVYDYAIVGGGVAAAYATEAIRELDPTGSLVLITEEELPPYDRTHVSKALMQGGKDVHELPLRSADFYTRHGVELRSGTRVETVDAHRKIIRAGGQELRYERALLATGGRPRQLGIPGVSGTKRVFTVRSAHDGERARRAVNEGDRVTIVGGSFIGLESAMSLGKQGGKITVVAREDTLFAKLFGPEVGRWIQGLHEAKGVHFRLGVSPRELRTEDGKPSALVLEDGSEIPTDVLIVGIGVVPATDYLAGLATNDDGSVSVDNHLAASVAGLYAAGDLARYPGRAGAVRIEHWKVAGQQGRIAGRNMAGQSEPYTMVPFFWSNQQGTNLRYVGHATDYDSVTFDGQPGDEDGFLAYYRRGDQLQAVLGVKRDGEVARIGEEMSRV